MTVRLLHCHPPTRKISSNAIPNLCMNVRNVKRSTKQGFSSQLDGRRVLLIELAVGQINSRILVTV
jgi:hypothetical protein